MRESEIIISGMNQKKSIEMIDSWKICLYNKFMILVKDARLLIWYMKSFY